MDWSITGGDLLQVGGIIAAAWLYVQRIDKRVGIMEAERRALERRVDSLEQGIRDDIKEIKGILTAVFDKLDRKADK